MTCLSRLWRIDSRRLMLTTLLTLWLYLWSYGQTRNHSISGTLNDSSYTTKGIPDVLKVNLQSVSSPRLITVKTDAVPWCGSIMNLGVEVEITPHISVALPVWYCPWFISDSHSLRVAALQPEGRWWLKESGEGHFAGIHASVAWYNLKWGRYRYQDYHMPLLGAGLTYGYAFRFDRHWGLELSAGVGFVYTRYDRFYNTHNGQLADRRGTSYFGPDHLSISLLYHINP